MGAHDENISFEESAYLLWDGKLPNRSQLAKLKSELSPAMALPGCGSNVSSWLGPPCIHRRMIDCAGRPLGRAARVPHGAPNGAAPLRRLMAGNGLRPSVKLLPDERRGTDRPLVVRRSSDRFARLVDLHKTSTSRQPVPYAPPAQLER